MIFTGTIDRSVLHLETLDTFFVSVERLNDSDRLTGNGDNRRNVRPWSGVERAVMRHVKCVSSAMPMKMARSMCPDAIVIRGDMEPLQQLFKYCDNHHCRKGLRCMRKQLLMSIILILPGWIVSTVMLQMVARTKAAYNKGDQDCPFQSGYL